MVVTRDDSGLFSPGNRRPVLLPRDAKPSGVRRVATSFAIVTLMFGVVTGVVYQRYWQTASHEVPRLLPASTLVHIHGVNPTSGLIQARRLAPLKQTGLSDLLQQWLSTWGRGSGALSPLSDLLQRADSIHFATIPAADQLGFFLLFEVRDDRNRMKLEDGLTPLMEEVDRELGFLIHELKTPQRLPWTPKTLPVRMVSMAPWLIFSVGPRESLSTLLQSRVSGTTQPILRRRGYQHVDAPDSLDIGHASAYFAPGALHDALRVDPGNASLPSDIIEARRALLVDGVEAFTASSRLVRPEPSAPPEEQLKLIAHFRRSEQWPKLSDILTPVEHAQVPDLPLDTAWAVSLGLRRPGDLSQAFRRIAELMQKEYGQPLEMPSFTRAIADLGLRIQGVSTLDLMAEAFSGNVMIAGLSAFEPELAFLPANQRWVMTLGGPSSEDGKKAVTELISNISGHSHALGTLFKRDETPDVHLALPHPTDDGPPPTVESLAWRVHNGVVQIAPNRRVFSTLDRATANASTLRTDVSWQALTQTKPDQSSALIVIHPALLGQSILGAAIASSMRPTWRLLGHLDISATRAEISLNMGLWTSLLALSRAPRKLLNRLVTPNVPAACLDALERVCPYLPDQAPCTAVGHLLPGLLVGTCRHLTAGGPI